MSDVYDKAKQVAWLGLAAYSIGLLVQRGWDSINHIPLIYENSLFDINQIIYGFFFMFLFIWSLITINTIKEMRLKSKTEFPETQKLIITLRNIFLSGPITSLFLFFIPIAGSMILASGINLLTVYFYINFIFITFACYLGVKDGIAGKKEPEGIETHLSDFIGTDGADRKVIMSLVFVALIQGFVTYPIMPQSMGGGRPEKVLIFLKNNNAEPLPDYGQLNGHLVDLIFKRQSKLGVRSITSGDRNILIIDDSAIDHIYAGPNLEQIDTNKLK